MTVIDLYSAEFIERVGFPIVASLMFLYLITWMIRKDEKRQAKGDERYSALVNEFIETMRAMTLDNRQAIATMSQQLQESITLINTGITKTQIRVSDMRKDLQVLMNNQKRG